MPCQGELPSESTDAATGLMWKRQGNRAGFLAAPGLGTIGVGGCGISLLPQARTQRYAPWCSPSPSSGACGQPMKTRGRITGRAGKRLPMRCSGGRNHFRADEAGHAPVVQRIEQRFPEPSMKVRFLPGVPGPAAWPVHLKLRKQRQSGSKAGWVFLSPPHNARRSGLRTARPT